ncbi:hypothetical protein FRACYDRAFT_238549 [Fragilariopsis cylindrus CCMP1102]|uniref:Uncharacterized protein n=1 Tax=Fragilariopsis cylindrus CCMP1102 TaxID=635003 RepID=A0A1E7FJ16_9STRA|nr:hypothetical protein FRACYDRAFT_238549 [Fragilariopsis cylindrus CCMP1102]|eukprot:OEU18114.1 hypothetical protein FRACYDRAFT_238549 [Fragilariopsis cylindrus CCMP1102]
MTSSGSIIILKPTPHLVTTNTISSTEYYRYDDVLNDVDDDQHQHDGEHYTPQLTYDDSMDTMDHVSVSSVVPPPPTTVNCIHTTTTSSCSSINSRFKVMKEKYLAPASPERASGKWMLMNAFCLVWSLSLGVYILLLYLYYDEFEQQQDDNDDDGTSTIDNPASRESTTDYLLWSLFTCFVWIIEVALRIAFPAVDTVIKVVKSKSTDNLEAATAAAAAVESMRSIITVETIVEHRNKKQITIIILELILAAYFVLQTIQDCYKHWKTHHHPRYQNDDENVNVYEDYYYDYFDTDDEDAARAGGGIVVYTILEQEVDVWVAVFAYAYMTYETYQKYYKIASTEHNIQRSLTNLTYGTIMGDDPPPPHDKDDRKQHQQQRQRQPIVGENDNDNDNDNDNEDTVEDGRNKKEDEDKGNTALLREVNVQYCTASFMFQMWQ